MSNDVLEAVKTSGLLPDLSSIVVGYIREPPRPYVYRPLPWVLVELDDRSDTFGSYTTDLLTLPGT
jgi:hypothetical protein